MKKSIIISAIAIGLILCAATWPQLETSMEEVYTEPTPPTVTAAQTDTPELPEEAEPLTAEEKDDAPQTEAVHDIVIEQEPIPAEVPTASEKQPEPKPAPTPAPPQTNAMPQAGDMVYVPGFGYLECQGPGEVTRSEAMYENGNKVGTMS